MDKEVGLHKKYDVFKAGRAESVEDCIVLRPDRDHHAIAALYFYAFLIQHVYPQFSTELIDFLAYCGSPEGWKGDE